MAKGYRFVCAGTFTGVTSFTDSDGTDVDLVKIDYMGGKVNVGISSEQAEKFSSKRPGCDVRIAGEVYVSGGTFRPVLSSISWDDDKDFEPVSMSESMAGLVFTGPAIVSEKRSFSKKDGGVGYEAFFQFYGGSSRLSLKGEYFTQVAEGEVIVTGSLASEFTRDWKGNVTCKNWPTIKGARSQSDGQKKTR